MSEKFLVPLYPGYYAANIPAGTFVLFTQGFSRRQILEKEATRWGDEYFEIVDATTDPPWGSSLWEVLPDNNLKLIKDNHDSSG